VKNGESSKPRNDNKEKHETIPRDEDNAFNHPQSIIGEIKTIAGGPSIGGSLNLSRSHRKGR